MYNSAFPPISFMTLGHCVYSAADYHIDICQESRTSVRIEHILTGAQFIIDCINNKAAIYNVEFYGTGQSNYATVETSEKNVHIFDWEGHRIIDEYPIIHPSVCVRKDFSHKFTKNDGVADYWVNRRVHFKKDTRLAISKFYNIGDWRKRL